ncbi:WW domain-containing oxidoreductase [Harmonia axyridis]|uniref:WW domain-containing oxidoreductase n=1 Tax=Harmonia axyridis TaxID=115357 RepID=UPI001E2772E1|nr:WW domain-containing oxidoreductase [Harmonia axyridis]XP_045469199.1 WW domain-containing oxidoreductase [Harmonia axyridis]XP_045469201.1 WW domain-containing oxidoreductase [Harmonia axyridis]
MNLPDTDSEDELPPGWEERVTVDGSVFYANHLQKATQWTHPRTGKKKKVCGDLPFGWERCVDKNTGKVIYVDHENKRTTYTDPRLAFAVEEKENANDYRQRFDAHTSALQILHGKDLNGKVAIITGGNTGIGFETARSLLKHGCTVIFACRNLKATELAIEKIKAEKPIPDNKCPVFYLDLGNLKTVKEFNDQVRQLKIQKIDILILNAGVFALPFTKTIDGYETTFQVNHLSHFYLACLFDDLLAVGSRVVVLSSESHRFADITFDNISELKLSPDTASKYWSMMAYNNSKLCNVLFARQLAKKLQNRGVSVFSVHPGNLVFTDISRHWWFYRLLFYLVRPFTKSIQQAAATTIFCAVAPELNGVTGCYFNNCYQCEESKMAQKDDLALALWEISTTMVERAVGEQKGLIFRI